MVKFKKKAGAALAIMALTAMAPVAAHADAVGTFAEVTSLYGTNAANYTYDITAAGEQVQEVILFTSTRRTTFTETHIREEASASSRSLVVLQDDVTVTIWGTTSNGWTKVFCENTEDGPVSGYIRSDLLNPAQ